MMETPKSNYWLDQAAAEIDQAHPKGEIVVSSGISPSASYHVGHFREILTADALTWALRQAGRQAKHIHVVDNFDPLRKRYDFLPEEFEQYVGQPICLVPDPFDDCKDQHKTYAEHFYQEFEGYARQMGIVPDEVIRSYEDLYKPGKMTQQFEQVLAGSKTIVKIFEDVSNRKLESDWTPVQVLDEQNVFHNARVSDWDQSAQTIDGASYADGHAKLNWRLDWPARWAVLGVMVEPFSAQEHGAAGSSYDTGVQFAREIFKIEPPVPGARYANIHLIGENTKMSSSKGNLITPAEALEIMPPEVLRYFVVRSRPDRTLYFDPGIGLFNLIDEFSGVQEAVRRNQPTEFKEAFEFATSGVGERIISAVRFNHLVTVFQTTQYDAAAALTILKSQSEYTDLDWDKEASVVEREFKFVKNWLAQYAPDEVKFEVQSEIPELELTDEQREFLGELADAIEKADTLDAQGMHDAIYEAKGDMSPNEAFQALYRVILGRDKGPRAGWFLASLDRDWLVRRLRREP